MADPISFKENLLKFESENSTYVFTQNCDYLPHTTFRFYLIDFLLNTDFHLKVFLP